jgi:site-specific DNA-cytosine methylase
VQLVYDKNLNRIRQISVREALTIQGFPKSYELPENLIKKDSYRLVGNSVAPPIAYLIMKSLKQNVV